MGEERALGELEADNLDFATRHYMPARPGEGDYCQVSYFVDKSRGSNGFSLWRRRNPHIAPDPLSGGSKEEIARGLRGLTLEYYDGLDWYDTWGDANVKKKVKYTTTARAQSFGISRGGADHAAAGSGTGQKRGEAGAAPGVPDRGAAGVGGRARPRRRFGCAGQFQFNANNGRPTGRNTGGGMIRMRRSGSILVGVLWCMVLLSVLVIGVLHTARMDLLVVKNYGDRVQAHYLALAGVERAKALIYQDVVMRQQTAKNHTGSLYNDAKDFQDVPLGRGKFRVFRRAAPDEGGGLILWDQR